VTYGFGPQALEKAGPDLLLDNLRELPPLLGNGGWGLGTGGTWENQ